MLLLDHFVFVTLENVFVGGVTARDKQGVHVVVNCERYSDCYRVTS